MRRIINIAIISLTLSLILELLSWFPPVTRWLVFSLDSTFLFTTVQQIVSFLFWVPLIAFFFIVYQKCYNEKSEIFLLGLDVKGEIVKTAEIEKSFGGWLFILAILLVLGVLASFINLAISWFQFFNAPDFLINATKKIQYFILTMDSFVAFFSIYLLIIFFGKKKNAPAIFAFFLCAQVMGALLIVLINDTNVASFSYVYVEETLYYLIKSVIVANIWVPYLLTSERVRRTFVV